jgi:hypothetical protein
MELIESTKLAGIVERILDARRKAHDMRWQMLLRDGSYAKAFFNTRSDEGQLQGVCAENSPSVDAEVADLIYSHLKYLTKEPVSAVGCEDALVAFIEVAVKTTNVKRIMDMYLSTQTQVELAFLWQNVSMLKSMDDGEMLVEFFEEFVKLVCRLPPLSLSSIWLEQNRPSTEETKVDGEAECRLELLALPQLGYLHESKSVDLHDPYFILVKFFETVEQYAIVSNGNRKGLLLSVCLALAVKSGRASLLLRTVCWLNENRSNLVEFDFSILKDLDNSLREHTAGEFGPVNDQLNGASQLQSQLNGSDIQSYSSMNESLQIRRMEGCMTLSFGKADHGKLGHGDTQVRNLTLPFSG